MILSNGVRIDILEWPEEHDWLECKRRAMVTVWKTKVLSPTTEWRLNILQARHSPIRRLRFSFCFDGIPSSVSVHICRHVHAQPYVQSQRNDRQDKYDRRKAPQDEPVNMILDVNAEELMTIANKRLCQKSSVETRDIVQSMCVLTMNKCPEFEGLLVPMCEYHGGVCHEMHPCERMLRNNN